MSLPVLQAEQSLAVALHCVCNTQTMGGELSHKFIKILINPE